MALPWLGVGGAAIRATEAAGSLAGDAVDLGTISRSQQTGPTGAPAHRGFLGKVWDFFRRPDVRAAREYIDAGTFLVPMAMGKGEQLISGHLGAFARVSMALKCVSGTFDLYQDFNRDAHHGRLAHGLVMAGGYMATTGAFIGLFGGLLPGAVMSATGTLIRAVGLTGYAISDYRTRHATPALQTAAQSPVAATGTTVPMAPTSPTAVSGTAVRRAA